MKREKELALTLATKLVEQDKSITDSKKMANASVEVAKILEQYLKESTPECFKSPYEQVFMGGALTEDVPKEYTYVTCKGCEAEGAISKSTTSDSTLITTEDNQQAYYTGGGKLP